MYLKMLNDKFLINLADKPGLAAKVGGIPVLKGVPGQMGQMTPKGLVPGLQPGRF